MLPRGETMPGMQVRLAESEGDLDDVRRLWRSFVAWHRQAQPDDRDLVDAYFDDAAWEQELAGLPGEYGPPGGVLLLARDRDLTLGCVALRRLDDESCEMKRMFVSPVARRGGVGRALATEVLRCARDAGYRRMYLDTSVRQTEAIALYRSLGFEQVEAYHDVPEAMRSWLVFFALDL